jgi:hypothetical protein
MAGHTGIWDAAKQAAISTGAENERVNAQTAAVQYETKERLGKFLLDEKNVTNSEFQTGRGMLAAEFIKRLKKLDPRFEFFPSPTKPHLGAFGYRQVNGEYEFLVMGMNGFVPEHSVHEVREEFIQDTSIGVDGKPPIQLADVMKQAHWVPKANIFGGEWEFEDKTQGLGWKKVIMPGKEITRGWRTILLRLIQAGKLTVSAAEKEFGPDNTPNWQFHTGKSTSAGSLII